MSFDKDAKVRYLGTDFNHAGELSEPEIPRFASA